MLAILDPELPHSSPSRRQSAALIGTLALIALSVGAVSPTARIASAAQPSIRAAHDTGFEQNSRLLGPERTDSAMEIRFDTQVSTHQQKQTEFYSSIDGHSASASAGASASASAASASAARMQVVLGSAAQQKDSDDRPALLAKILRTDTSQTIRTTAAWGLREYAGTTVAAEALANAVMHDKEACVREMAAWALGDGDDNSSVGTAALSSALRSDINDNVRRTAAWSLGRIGGRDAVPALTAALSDHSSDVRQRAAWALGNVDPGEAPKELVAMLRDKDPHVRELAAWALFRIEDPATAPAIEAALKGETDKEVQLADIRALAALGEKSVEAIKGLIESPDPRIRTMAVRALAGGHATGPWPWPWPEPRPFP
jgi:HEAT repeat protein